jgi:hypothetical protein
MIHAETDERIPWVPKSEEEKDQVRRQMHRLLETAHFKNSRRYPALFQFIVEETLEGRGEFLKERLLGVRVFHRPPDYDTANDPIVRVTIAEIRKRIAQYYHEAAHDTEMRIELMPGRYEPEFRRRRPPCAGFEEAVSSPPQSSHSEGRFAEALVFPPAHAEPATTSVHTNRGPGLALLARCGLAAAALTLLALVSTLLWRWARPSAIEELWEPVLAAHRPITFCVPTGAAQPRDQIAVAAGILTSNPAPPPRRVASVLTSVGGPTPSFLEHENEGENVVFSDVLAALKISDWMAEHGRESNLRSNNLTTLYDLQQGPTVLIGGLDNEWTLRALAHLRYRFSGSGQEQYWIVDTKNPGRRDWGLDLKARYPAVKYDFALVARLHDESTGQIQVIAAGVGMSGTAAAGKFLVDAVQLEELQRRIGPGFRNHDFEAVLGTDVINGIAGSPKILAVAVW